MGEIKKRLGIAKVRGFLELEPTPKTTMEYIEIRDVEKIIEDLLKDLPFELDYSAQHPILRAKGYYKGVMNPYLAGLLMGWIVKWFGEPPETRKFCYKHGIEFVVREGCLKCNLEFAEKNPIPYRRDIPIS